MGRHIRRAVLLALLLALPAGIAAQTASGVVAGRVVASGAPLAGASVAAYAGTDSVPAARGLTDASGRFRLAGLAPGRYRVRVGHLGHAEGTAPALAVRAGAVTDAGTLTLDVAVVELDPLTVEAERPMVTYEADRTAYQIGSMPSAVGGSIADAMLGIPELEVGIDGEVLLRGRAPQIYLDGRPAPMRGESLSAFLAQFPADLIERIEVIDNPSARFGAEGSAGVVNVVLREGIDLGVSGSVFLNGGTRGQLGAGGRATVQRGPWTLAGGTSLRWTDRESTGWDLRQNLLAEPTTFLRQDDRSTRSALSAGADVDLRWDATERTRLWTRVRLGGDDSDAESLRTTSHLDAREEPTLRYDRATASDARGLDGNARVGVSHAWEPRRHELEVEVELERGGRDQDSEMRTRAEASSGDPPLLPAALTLEETGERETGATVTLDYTRPWLGESRLEVGGQLEVSETEDDRSVRFGDGPAAPGEEVTGYVHAQRFTSAYATLNRSVAGIGLQAGLRAEHTDVRFEPAGGGSHGNDYWSFFPSASATYRVDRGKQVRLSYARRIGRPSARVLDPTDRSNDPLERRVGDSSIGPQLTHSVTLNASWEVRSTTLRLSPQWRRVDNDWAEVTTVDAEGISTRTWRNVASRESWGAALSLSARPFEGWSANLTLSGEHERRDASNLASRYSGSSTRWSTRANVTGRLPFGLTLQSTLSHSPPVDGLQGRSSGRTRSDLGLRYQFLDRRGSVRLSLTDPFGLATSSVRSSDVSYVQLGRSRENTRSASLAVTWALGRPGGRQGEGAGPRR